MILRRMALMGVLTILFALPIVQKVWASPNPDFIEYCSAQRDHMTEMYHEWVKACRGGEERPGDPITTFKTNEKLCCLVTDCTENVCKCTKTGPCPGGKAN